MIFILVEWTMNDLSIETNIPIRKLQHYIKFWILKV